MPHRMKKTPDGGRIASAETMLGDYLVEFSAAGEIVRHEITIREPQERPRPSDVQRNIDQRENGCAGCGQ